MELLEIIPQTKISEVEANCKSTTKMENEMSTPLIDPLKIDLILEKVIDYLQPKDLPAARLVCHQWNQYATESQRRKARNSIYFHEEMTELLERIKSSFDNPFANFALCLGRFVTPEKISMLNEFFTTCGSSLKQLELQMDFRTVGVKFIDLPNGEDNSAMDGQMRNLESLKMWYDASLVEFIGLNQLSFLKSLLANGMDNLKLITWYNFSPNFENESVTDLLCQMIAQKRCFPSLQEINLQSKISTENLQNLTKFSGKFKKIELLFKNSNFECEKLAEFLEAQRKSTEYLKITAEKICRFPRFEKLISLDLNISKFLEDNAFTRSSFFGYNDRNNFPKLRKVQLSYSMLNEIFGKPQYRSCSFPTVESLRFYKCIEHNPAEIVPQIPNIFPNIKKLRLRFQPDWIKCVFESLVGLEELVIDENNLVRFLQDSVLTGISASVCDDLKKQGVTKNIEVEHLRTEASLLNLQKLRRFRLLNLNRSSNASACSDLSGYFAFLQMKNLESVTTYLHGFSNTCLAEMKEQFDVVSSIDYLRSRAHMKN